MVYSLLHLISYWLHCWLYIDWSYFLKYTYHILIPLLPQSTTPTTPTSHPVLNWCYQKPYGCFHSIPCVSSNIPLFSTMHPSTNPTNTTTNNNNTLKTITYVWKPWARLPFPTILSSFPPPPLPPLLPPLLLLLLLIWWNVCLYVRVNELLNCVVYDVFPCNRYVAPVPVSVVDHT